MQNAQDLLDSFGSPPPDVCLDWAWQLLSLAHAGQLPEHFSWNALQVSKQGEIVPRLAPTATTSRRSTNVSQFPSFQSCFIQLLNWWGIDNRVDSVQLFSKLENVQLLLTELTCQRHRTTVAVVPEMIATEPLRQASSVTEELKVLQSTSVHASDTRATEDIAADILATVAQPSEDHRLEAYAACDIASVESRPPLNVSSKSHFVLLATSAAAVLIVGLASWWWFSSGDGSMRIADSTSSNSTSSNSTRSSQPASDVSGSKSKNGKSTSGGSARSSKSIRSSTSEMDQLLGGASTNDLSDSNNVDSLGSPSASDAAVGELSGGKVTGEKEPISDSSAKALELLDVKTSPAALTQPTEVTDVDRSTAIVPSTDALPPKLDVASETSQDSVAKLLASSSTSDTKITSMSNQSGGDSQATKPAVLLNVEDLVQIQEIPNGIRVRQPTWELRLSSTSSIDVEPAGMLTLVEKTSVRWVLSSKELKPRKGQEPTKVAVIAEIANRRGDVRWTIVAGTQDLPNLRFPMNQERLDQLLSMLQSYQQRLGVSIDQIKAAMDLPDFPKEQRSFWSGQRKSFETEAKLTTRARQVVADASMLTSWMDRTIEVHGRLLDTMGSKSDIVLEFGQAESKQADTP